MRRSLPLLPVLTLLLAGCEPDSLKELIEDKFSDFKGLQTPLAREYIVGLRPAPTFNNLHCCWVGKRTGWKEITGSWKTEKKTKVSAGVLNILKAFSIEIDAKSTSYVEVKAEPFYRDQLMDIRHLPREHCDLHPDNCSKEICVDSLKVGRVLVETYSTGEAKVKGSDPSSRLEIVRIGGENYVKDSQEARDVIVGYKVAPTMCGKQVYWGDRQPSGGGEQSERYEDHYQRFREGFDLFQKTSASSDVKDVKPFPDLIPARSASPVSILGPPPGNVLAGEVIRVSTVDSSYVPNPPLRGLVVTETRSDGSSQQREMETDASGGAWIPISPGATQVVISLEDKPVYLVPVSSGVPLPEEPPALFSVHPYQGESPPWMVEAGTLVELEGENFGVITSLRSGGRELLPVVVGHDYVVAKLEGQGKVPLQLTSAQGLTSAPVDVTLIRIVPETVPPSVLQTGQVAEVVLRLEGTEESVPVLVTLETQNIQFSAGGKEARLFSSGGGSNQVRFSIRATEAGPYRIGFRLTGP